MNIKSIGINSAWDNKVKGHAYVGVVDSGVDIGHPDFSNSLREHFSFDFSGNAIANTSPQDYGPPDNNVTFDPLFPGIIPGALQGVAGHGQHVVGIIAADNNNAIGTSGICWNCSLSFARGVTSDDRITGLDFIANHGSQVVNASFGNSVFPVVCGGINDNPALCDALELLSDRDIVNVASSGNGLNQGTVNSATGRNNFIQFPASDPRVIAVGAVDSMGARANFSDHGNELDFVAPGVNTLSTMVRGFDWNLGWSCGDNFDPQTSVNMNGYGLCSGTSMSAPHVTGLVSLIRSVDPLLSRFDVKDILKTSASEYDQNNPTVKDLELGFGIPDGGIAVENALGIVNGGILNNRLTPLFSFYSSAGQDSFYTTVPQMATASIKGTLLPQPTSSVDYFPTYGVSTFPYVNFPDVTSPPGFGPPLPSPTARAEVYIFTTEKNPIDSSEPLVPLYRLSYQGANGNNSLNLDHVYTTSQTGITAYKNVGYLFDGIEGYIHSNVYPKPTGAVGLHRRYNPTRDDHAIFPASQLTQMISSGYTVIDGNNSLIGYVYPNQDTDNDHLVDGFEEIIGTCINSPDSNNNGILDGVEVLGYPRIDPLSNFSGCGSVASPSYPWQENAVGTQYTNFSWDYALGYHFTPLVNGSIDQLGGLFNGVKQVKLFNKTTGQLLAQANVSSNNNWEYVTIVPVSVQANQTYTIAVYMAGSGGSYRYSASPMFPMIINNNFSIDSSTYIYTGNDPDRIPINNASSNYIYGQADLRFTPN